MGRTVLSCGQAVFKSEYTPTTPKHLVVDFIASASEYKKNHLSHIGDREETTRCGGPVVSVIMCT